MARDADPDTATREFYFNVADNPKLDTAREKTGNAGYAVFGKVVRGMDVLDAIRVRPTTSRPAQDMQDVPVEPVVLVKVRRVSQAEALGPKP
jgi:peptidyl-prolyl cis-trans isomerase A (cyclophilin A)